MGWHRLAPQAYRATRGFRIVGEGAEAGELHVDPGSEGKVCRQSRESIALSSVSAR